MIGDLKYLDQAVVAVEPIVKNGDEAAEMAADILKKNGLGDIVEDIIKNGDGTADIGKSIDKAADIGDDIAKGSDKAVDIGGDIVNGSDEAADIGKDIVKNSNETVDTGKSVVKNSYKIVNVYEAKINIGQQNKHIPGTNEYKISVSNGEHKSIMYGTLEDMQTLLDDKAGTGEFLPGIKNRERVDFGKTIGLYIDSETNMSS